MTLALAESELQGASAVQTVQHPEAVVYQVIGSLSPASVLIKHQPGPSYLRTGESTADFLGALREVADLGANWDSYGAEPFDEIVVERAKRLIVGLVRNDVPPPRIIPAASGSILLEWSTDLLYLEIDIDPRGEDSVFIEKETGGTVEYVGHLSDMNEFHTRELNGALTTLITPSCSYLT